MDLRRLLRLSAAGLAAAGLLVSGCTSGDSSSGGTSPESGAPAALKKYYGQKLDWHGCGVPDFQCATMRAPLDYEKADGAEIKLAVARKKATGPGKRLGSLQVNPGGPGGSAVDYLQGYAGIGYPEPVRARYDMVAVDPRGVSRSSPVECLTGKEMDAFTQVDQTPDDTTERNLLAASYKKLAQGCAKRSADILPHVSTIEAARDMDILRAALGDEKLSYVGASYGTFLGATYAELFPKRVGRLVLDGAMDPSLPADEMNRDQTAGFETAFSAFAADCVKQPDCPLGTVSAADAAQRMKSFFDTLDSEPVPTGEPRELGESLATTGVINAMYDESGWPGLRDSLTSAMDGDGSGLLALADSYYEREGDGSFSNLMYANAAVNCLDLPAAFNKPADVDAAAPSFQEASPVFGTALAWAGLNCAYWPTEATGTPHRIAAKGAPPILVVGTTRDPATPYKWAQSLAEQLASGVLLTYDGDGHTAYGRGSDCVDTAINTYLLEGTPPKNGKKC
ncbi:alpha/beta hydrolase [Streptomyces sp. IB2014 016-6]|uniref:alpha/beta hydrolase n=1 Tax=Streptomyces sp. IB2014 016-6 TaxID=2517818 RepID=UPI0011CB635E|nr:alpha/beta hydrolase [Streptomyces sp. IB2014 016-6]TXL91448.1 alpha/beta hydrolase [Streptomyces sp. IB2014 016-6]